MDTKAEIKAYSKSELAALYGVSQTTFRKWTREIKDQLGSKKNQILTPQQVAVVFEFLGLP